MDIQFTVQHNIGNTITVPNQLETLAKTYFSQDTQSGTTILNVINTGGFAPSGIILAGALVQETAEFIPYSVITATTITATASLFNHNRGEQVSVMNYNTIVVETATSPTGSFSIFGTFSIQPTGESTVIQHSAGSTGTYYRIKFRNSASGLVSDYSPVVSPTTNDPRSISEMFDSVRTTMGISSNDTLITTEFLLAAFQDGREYVDNVANGVHWDWRTKFDFPIKLLAGTNFINLPDDIDFDTTNRSILGVRYPRANYLTPIDLIYIDKKEWNRIAYQTRGSVLAADVNIGDTTLSLVNSGDFFTTGGDAFIATTGFLQTIDSINYTGMDPITNQLTGVTGVTRTIPAGTQVLAFTAITSPYYYTVYENKIVFDRIIPDAMQGTNVYVDYYKRLMPITDVNEVIPERYRTAFKSYMKFRIKARKDSNVSIKDSDYIAFTAQITSVLNSIYSGQTLQIIP